MFGAARTILPLRIFYSGLLSEALSLEVLLVGDRLYELSRGM